MATEKHVAIIRGRLEKLLRELRAAPLLSQGQIAAAVESLLLEFEGKDPATAEPTWRKITLSELRDRLTDMPGARPVLEAIDTALADGTD